MSSLYSLELEKTLLSGLILNPQVRAEIPYITPQDFSTTNRVVLSAIDACLASGQQFSEYLLVDRLNSLGIKIADAIDPGVYVMALKGLSVGENAVVGVAKQIKTISIRRKLHETGQKIVKVTERDEGKKAGELVAEATEIFNGQVNLLGGSDEDEPKDLFAGMESYIESIGSDPAELGPQAPYALYQRIWGGFTPGDMSVYCARPKGSKSTFLMNTVEQCVEQDPDVVCLMLDTELETERVMRRMVSSMTGINEYYIRTGLWRKDHTMAGKVRAAWSRVNNFHKRISHIYVGGKTTEEQLSICRRWYHKHAKGKSKKVLICLDYIKLGSVDLDNLGAIKDYQSVGKKVDQFKQLATELQCHVLTAAQTNRSNEGRDVATRRSDGAAIGLSDFISQYASNIYLLEKLTDEQVGLVGSLECTHTLTCVYARNLGAEGAAPMVKYTDDRGKDRWTDNYVFYSIKNFRVEEKYDFRTLVDRNRVGNVPIQAAANSDADNPLL